MHWRAGAAKERPASILRGIGVGGWVFGGIWEECGGVDRGQLCYAMPGLQKRKANLACSRDRSPSPEEGRACQVSPSETTRFCSALLCFTNDDFQLRVLLAMLLHLRPATCNSFALARSADFDMAVDIFMSRQRAYVKVAQHDAFFMRASGSVGGGNSPCMCASSRIHIITWCMP